LAERLGKNELVTKIGQGGMAEVYLARAALAQGLQKLVVVKKIHGAFSRSPHFARMFRSEAYMATLLNHPNIVQVFDYGKEGDDHYLVMEYVEGYDLMRVVKMASRAGQRVPYGIAAYAVQELLKGLDYAHRKTGPGGEPLDIVHRDVSPQNVLISVDGAVKLVDFGIAKTRTQVEEEGVVKGKYAYMAPEQASGLAVDKRCDVFAAGVILYELLTGRTLFGGLKGEEALQAVRSAKIPPPTQVDPDVPEALVPLVMRALARLPENRFATARDFQHALTRFLYRQEEIYDTAALASFLSRIRPEEPAPETEGAPVTGVVSRASDASAVGRTGISDSDLQVAQGTRSGTGPITERKKVLLVCGQFASPEASEAQITDTVERRWMEAVGRFTAIAEDIVFKHEAVVDEISPQQLTALVGLPVATEEDAGRAVELARALLDAFAATCQDYGIEAGLGFSITRGFATMERRSDGGFDYEVSPHLLGLGFLLASRATDHSVLVDGSVRKAAEEEWELQEVPLLSKQLREAQQERSTATDPGTASQPTRVFRLLGPAEAGRETGGGAPDRLVGRVLEMKALQDAYWDMQRNRSGRVVVVYADKGMGKRTLVRSFLSGLQEAEAAERCQVIRMVARQTNQMVVHATLSEIARQFVTRGHRIEGDALRQRIREIAGFVKEDMPSDVERDFVTPLEVLLGLAEQGVVANRDPEEMGHEIQEALYRLLRWRSTKSPLVLILENAHLASRLTLDTIGSLARRLKDRPILAVLTAQHRRDRDELLPGIKGLAIHLAELGPQERRELALQRFADAAEAEPLVKQVLDRAGGNPYYIEAILESLVEQGICVRDDQDDLGRLRWARQGGSVQIPATVEALVASRLDRLPPELRDILRKAAVLGKVFELSQLRALCNDGVEERLRLLEQRHLVYAMSDAPGRWAFYQQVIQDVAYSGLAPADAAELHLQAAQALLDDPRYQPGPGDARVAHQLQLAGKTDEAVERYLSAAAYARDVSGNREAYQLMSLALELQPSDPQVVFGIHLEREQILRGWGRRRKQEEEIQRLRELAEVSGKPELLAKAMVRRLRFLQDGGKANQVLQAFEETMDAAVQANDPLVQADVLRLRARALNDLGRNEEALDSVSKALRLIPEDQRGTRMRGELLHTQGNIRFYTGQMSRAVESFAEALALFRKLRFKRLEANMLMNIGFVSQCMGEYEGALKYYQESYNIDLQIGDRFTTGLKLANIGQAYAEIGQFDRAEKYLRKAVELSRAVEDVSGESDALTTLGQVRLWQKNVGSARRYLLDALQLAQDAESAYGEMRARIYVAFAKLEAGEPPEGALQEARQATDISRRSDMPQGIVFGLAVQALALEAMGRAEEGLARSSEAMTMVATGTPIVGVEEALHVHASLLHRLGRTTEAKPFMQRALDEIVKKARRLKQPDRQRSFLETPVIRDILTSYTRIIGPLDGLLPDPGNG
jgi:serine/threonine protein kinase/predicted ATPase